MSGNVFLFFGKIPSQGNSFPREIYSRGIKMLREDCPALFSVKMEALFSLFCPQIAAHLRPLPFPGVQIAEVAADDLADIGGFRPPAQGRQRPEPLVLLLPDKTFGDTGELPLRG